MSVIDFDLFIALLRKEFESIRDENMAGANTAERIGKAFLDLLELSGSSLGSFLRKDVDDVAHGCIIFEQGIEAGQWCEGLDGAAIWKDAKNNWHFECDFVNVRKKLSATEVEIQEIYHVGGQLLLTAASARCAFVRDMGKAFRCYFPRVGRNGETVFNTWKIGDQARCQTFNLTSSSGQICNHYYWRMVVGVSSTGTLDEGDYVVDGETVNLANYHWIDLSKEDFDSRSDNPIAGDSIVQLGYRGTDDPDRQNATIIAGAGISSPYIAQFIGINDYHLPEPETQIKPGKNILTGVVNILPGSTLPNGGDVGEVVSNLVNGQASLQEDMENLDTGNCNLLVNSGFTGDYESDDAVEDTSMSPDTQMYSPNLKHWDAEGATVVADVESASGFSAVLDDGVLRQRIAEPLVSGSAYCISLKAGGSHVSVSIGGCRSTLQLDDSFGRKVLRMTCADAEDDVFVLEGTCKVAELQLTRGNVPNADWLPSPNDNDKVLAYMQNLSYLTNAILNASTSIIGGLLLTEMIRVGNYRDKVMVQETGGMSGIYTSEQSPFLWGGGTMEQAFYTIGKYARDPSYQATEEEVRNMAKFVVTHGGRAILNDIVLRGYIYAFGGHFKGTVEASDGVFRGEVYAEKGIFNGEVNADKGVFRNVASPNGSFQIDEKGDLTIKGNLYTPLFIINESNYSTCVVPTGRTGFGYIQEGVTVDLVKTGLNVQFDYIPEGVNLSVCLPLDECYQGAIVRIMNNSSKSLFVITKGTVHGGMGGGAGSRGVQLDDNTYGVFACLKDIKNTDKGYRWINI